MYDHYLITWIFVMGFMIDLYERINYLYIFALLTQHLTSDLIKFLHLFLSIRSTSNNSLEWSDSKCP